jgi:hypothetical protein
MNRIKKTRALKIERRSAIIGSAAHARYPPPQDLRLVVFLL